MAEFVYPLGLYLCHSDTIALVPMQDTIGSIPVQQPWGCR